MNKIHLFNLKSIFIVDKLPKNSTNTRISNINTADKIIIKTTNLMDFLENLLKNNRLGDYIRGSSK